MAIVLCVGTFGAHDPTQASLPFVMALRASERGDDVSIVLMGDATLLMKDQVASQVRAASWPPFQELLRQVVEHAIPVLICAGCGGARGVSGDDLVNKNAKFASPQVLLELKVTADKVLTP